MYEVDEHGGKKNPSHTLVTAIFLGRNLGTFWEYFGNIFEHTGVSERERAGTLERLVAYDQGALTNRPGTI